MDINTKIDSWLLGKQAARGKYIAAHNNASALGGPCLRELVYRRVCPENARDHDARTLGIFELGNEFERIYKKWLAESGIDVTYEQVNAVWEEEDISGHIDGMIDDCVIEIKSCSPFNWSIEKAEDCVTYYGDIRKSVSDWFSNQPLFVCKYLCQIVIYLWLMEKEKGLLLLINKATGERKQIEVNLEDWINLADALLGRSKLINLHRKRQTLPDKINRKGYCDKYCDFYEHCKPELSYGPDIKVVENKDVIKDLDYVAIADEERLECDRANKRWKSWFTLPDGVDHAQWLAGKHLIEAKRTKSNSIRITRHVNDMDYDGG